MTTNRVVQAARTAVSSIEASLAKRDRNRAAALTLLAVFGVALVVGGVGYLIRGGQIDDRQHVQAELVTYPEAIGDDQQAVALVSYTTTDGAPHQRRAFVPILSNYGDTTLVWVHDDGTPADAPLRLRHLAFAAGVSALAVVLVGSSIVRDRHERYREALDA